MNKHFKEEFNILGNTALFFFLAELDEKIDPSVMSVR